MATTTLHPAIASALDRCSVAYNNRDETIDRLNDLTSVDWIVNAEPATRLTDDQPLWTYARCANDSDHGRGSCAVEDTEDLLCPDCAVDYVRQQLVADAQINVEVML